MPTQRMPKTYKEKKEVITWIETSGGGVPTRAEKRFRDVLGWKVSGAQIRCWWKNREAVMQATDTRLRMSGGGSKPVLGELEDLLFDMILFRRANNEKVTRIWIQTQAVNLAREELGNETFQASDNWLASFMQRYHLSLRRTTNLTVLSSEELVQRAFNFLAYLVEHLPLWELDRVVLMDEMAVFFEDPRRQTVNEMSARHVVMRTTGFASMQMTVILAVTAAGRKLPPVMIMKGKNVTAKVEKRCGVYIMPQPSAWTNKELLIEWLDIVFPSVLDQVKTKAIIWDSMRAHIAKVVKAHCAKKNIAMVVIPGGLTPYVQAGDIGIYKSFENKMSTHINKWKRFGRVEFTRGGNPKPPNIDEVVQWVRLQVPESVVMESVWCAGFDPDFTHWHISKHGVYGEAFSAKWIAEDRDVFAVQAANILGVSQYMKTTHTDLVEQYRQNHPPVKKKAEESTIRGSAPIRSSDAPSSCRPAQALAGETFVLWVAESMRPLTIVEDRGFIDYINFVLNVIGGVNLKISGRAAVHGFNAAQPSSVNSFCHKLNVFFPLYSLTTDIWTDSLRAFALLTHHCVNEGYQSHNYLLSVGSFPGKHDADRTACVLESSMKKRSLGKEGRTMLVRDDASNAHHYRHESKNQPSQGKIRWG
ncbi:TPA: LOW QUALITY PROTEIN: hypothetical protein N0F65_000949 [Lagenidium giganteum]|uniref:HTH CENPB-type domain-containing protein n=1 Tax=Lagenidium giganteum TaxID=4803 RepID=A0AAV2YNJ4_9STRA|nr:TPA: LOW QUALITY PROTEIN: hypothetical protein N0F65_000949 [Lagenidium giganteum]